MEINKIINWIGNGKKIPATEKFDYKEKSSNKGMLRRWEPFEDTLSAAIMSGLEIIPINKSTNILYIGKIDKEKQFNYLDLIENKQKNFIFDKEYKNMNSEIENFQYIDNLEEIKGKLFSVIYVNDDTISIKNIINILDEFLDEFGYLIIVLSRSSEKEFNDSFKKLSESLHVIQEINIENYFSNKSLIIFSNKKIISEFN
jgi:fibrillarin-like rRNA methylase